MKILLVALPEAGRAEDYTTPGYFHDHFLRYPPLGLLALIPALDRHHSVTVLDFSIRQISLADAIGELTAARPDLVGFSVMTRLLYPFAAIARGLRQRLPQLPIVAGGPHVTRFPRETLALGVADYALPGYGEFSFAALVRALERGPGDHELAAVPNLWWRDGAGAVRVNASAPLPVLLDSLPFPDRDHLNPADYRSAADRELTTTVYSSRGCPQRCIFCDVVDKRFRFRSPASLVSEFAALSDRGIRSLHVFDDTFNLDRERVLGICREIRRRRLNLRWSARCRVVPFDREMAGALADAGCFRLHVGVESFDDQLLRAMQKGISLDQVTAFFSLCREFGFETMAYFIIGFPGESSVYRQRLYENIRRLAPTYFFINILFPLPQTAYYQSLLDHGTYARDYWDEFINHPQPDFHLPLPRSATEQRELEVLADECPRRYYLSPGFILRELWRLRRSPSAIMARVRLALILLTVGLRRTLGRRAPIAG